MFLWWFTNGRERKLVGTSERVHWLVQPGLRWELTAEWFISLQTSQVIVLCGAWVTGMACYFYQLLLCKGLVEFLFSFVNNIHPNVLLAVNTYLMDGWVLEHRHTSWCAECAEIHLAPFAWKWCAGKKLKRINSVSIMLRCCNGLGCLHLLCYFVRTENTHTLRQASMPAQGSDCSDKCSVWSWSNVGVSLVRVMQPPGSSPHWLCVTSPPVLVELCLSDFMSFMIIVSSN